MADANANALVAKPTPGQATPLHAMQVSYGDSGLKAFGGYLNEEFLRQLSGDQGKRVYREMSENDATIGAILQVFTALICGVEWTWTEADETPAALEAKKFGEGVFEDMATPLRDVIAEACTMFTFGFAPMEITYKQRLGRNVDKKALRSKFDDGKIGIREIALRAQNTIIRWEIDRATGELLGVHQQTTWKGSQFIPLDKLALFRTTSVKNSPEGRSVLRSAYRAWFFKTKMEEIEAIGVERDLAGLPVLRIPNKYLDPNASSEDKAFYAACQRMVTQIRRESREGIVLAGDVYVTDQGQNTGTRMIDLQLLTSGGSRTFDTNAIIGRYDRAMATSVLMDFLFLGQQSVGSWALSSDKTALSAAALGAYVKRIQDVLNTQVIEPLFEVNGFDPKVTPKITAGDLEKADLAELAGFISALTGAGMQLFPDRDVENFLRKTAGLPLAPEEDGLEDQGAPGAGEDWGAPEPAPVAKSGLAESLARLTEILGAEEGA